MKAHIFVAVLLLFCLGCTSNQKPGTWTDTASHKSGFVTANGIKINYLDWGGTGPVLVLIHGYGDNPHVFDDLAPAFTDRFRVIAYARRGHGRSDAKGPYDGATMTEDLRGLMDALGITKAHLAGDSLGGNEITAMASKYPQRVDRIVYLDAGYDWADSSFGAGFQAIPPIYLAPPASAMKSLDAYRAYIRFTMPAVSDSSRFEAYIRDLVVVQPDKTVRQAMSDSVGQAVATAMFAYHRDYTKVHSPALAMYATTMFDLHNGDSVQLAENVAWENKYMVPFRVASKERIRRELANVEIIDVPGNHPDFFFASREQVVGAMRRFLSGSAPQR